MPNQPRRSSAPESSSNIVSDLINLIRTLSEHAGAMPQGATGTGSTTTTERQFTTPGGGRGVFGVSVRVGLGDDNGTQPVVNTFGNMTTTNEGVVVSDTREPLTDVFDEGSELLVMFELPGVARDDITVELTGDVLSLSAHGPRHRYESETLLPSPVDPTSAVETYQNGYLQLRYRKIEPGPQTTDRPEERDD